MMGLERTSSRISAAGHRAATRPIRAGALLSCFVVLFCAACDRGPGPPALDLPERPPDAPLGSELARTIRDLELEAREARIYDEIARGNVPSWFHRLRRVELRGEIDGRRHRLTFWVAPDYLAVGADEDYLLIPLTARTAGRVAEHLGASLPTPRMVDAIWSSARVRLAPIRIPPDEFMTTVPYFERHDRLVASQRWLRGIRPHVFVAGHKLDLVLTTASGNDSGRAAVYGWHRADGRPIQPLYTDLGEDWAGYQVGVRLVSREVLVDGARRDLLEVLRDPILGPLLAGNG
jgi:hypothetical protein